MTDKFLICTGTPSGAKTAIPKDQVESIIDNRSQRHIKMTSGVGYTVLETFDEILNQYESPKSNSRSSSK